VGVAAGSDSRDAIVLAALAGLVAGALSMAAGEYVSVSSQTDLEKADIERERKEIEEMPALELTRLTEIYEKRGLKKETAALVAAELTSHDALGAHVRDELGITHLSQAKPLQAAFASGASFTIGAMLPFLVAMIAPLSQMIYYQYGFSTAFLILLGTVAARTGGSNVIKAILRITFWGTAAMALTAAVGYLFGTTL
jgi:VIT1/CCC1 family predicted Fe2+/Mn2+ transporter